MRKIGLGLLGLLLCQYITAQETIKYRVILIGDAGEIDSAQQTIIPDAANRVLAGKTTVVYLGDNIYPRGIAIPGTADQERTENVLKSQFQPLRSAGAAVYFIPGNHDWDRMGKNGLVKIKRQWQFIEEQNDPLLKLVPKNGCPDPVVINLADSIAIIAFDSEWWLFPFSTYNPYADCDCNNREEILAKFDELLYANRYKVVLLASHHPFQSYGTHGGKFSFKNHIFPLTTVSKNLYIPMPVVGSLYPILRKTFTNPEDLHHPLYKDMRRRIDGAINGAPNVVHVAGHEHGLQYIVNKRNGHVQVVSGAGAKQSHTIKGKYSLYGKTVKGYVIADLLVNNILRFSYYIYRSDSVELAFQTDKPYTSVKKIEQAVTDSISGDSIAIAIRPEYNTVSKFKRKLLGENYRKEFATVTKLPVIRLSKINGGLTPEKRGGGMQTLSLRLRDKNNNEYVIRNLEKNPDPLLPPELRETFARDLLDDYMSAQYPFAPLVVPPLARAAGVPHANPIIGVIAPDTILGPFQGLFAGKVALLEERNPLGKSDNTGEMQEALLKDNDNNYNSKTFLRARLLDLLLADWDRHADQWRWADTLKGKQKFYEPIPRDRDQALYRREGIIPSIAARSYILPNLQGFSEKIPKVKYSLFKTQFAHQYMADQFSLEEWMQITKSFTAAMTDSVIDDAFRHLPATAYALRGKELAEIMKVRRNNIPKAMEEFYRFINRRLDIQGTNKNEFVEITGTQNGGLHINIRKINKEGQLKDVLVDKDYDPAITKEIRLYLENGDDSLVLNNSTSRIKLRIIGGRGDKDYNIIESKRRVRLYDRPKTATITGNRSRLITHFSKDSMNTALVPVNLYNITQPLITGGFNLDDGIIFGLGFKHRHQGFRKLPYGSEQSLLASHSFSTKAYRIQYKGDWLEVFGKADLIVRGLIKAPDNTQNFFGRGNETEFNKSGDFKRYYRSRFATYQADVAVRYRGAKGSSFSLGPSIQVYRFNKEDNTGRFILNKDQIGSYDSTNIEKDKVHLGAVLQYINDTRNNKIFTAWGSYVSVRVQAYDGLNKNSRSFIQILPEVAIYKSLNARQTLILANRVGGGVTIGKTAFYQSQFLGGHENLLGYRQYRFAGQHSLYNNLELRVKVADVAGYILPGQIGVTGFFDVGRVWEKGENSGKWHNGVGGGVYFAPAKIVVLQLLAGYSREGWYPYFTFGFRF